MFEVSLHAARGMSWPNVGEGWGLEEPLIVVVLTYSILMPFCFTELTSRHDIDYRLL